jgi:hypothetical protein
MPYERAERTAGLSAAPSPGRSSTEAAAVLRRHLRRHPVVTGEHAPYLRSSTPPRVCAMPPSLLPLHRARQGRRLASSPLLALLATAHVRISLRTGSISPGHALPGVVPPSPESQPAAAATVGHCCAPSPGPPPCWPTPPIASR